MGLVPPRQLFALNDESVFSNGLKGSFSILGNASLDFKELACSLYSFFFFSLVLYSRHASFPKQKVLFFYECATIARLLPMSVFAMQGKEGCLSCLFVLGCVVYKDIANNEFAGHALSCSQPRVAMRAGGCCRNGISMVPTCPECKQCHHSLVSSHK